LISFTQEEFPVLPTDIAFAITQCSESELYDQVNRNAKINELFRFLSRRFEPAGFVIKVQKEGSGRPVIHTDKSEWGASITHSRGYIACAINRSGDIGLDLEIADRREHPGLRQRVISAEDDINILESCSTIRLWTIKEAVLKMHGSGLRIAMNNVTLMPGRDNLVEAKVQERRGMVYSGLLENCWLALAWPALEEPAG
jgi:phosphopantetheinyl transferase